MAIDNVTSVLYDSGESLVVCADSTAVVADDAEVISTGGVNQIIVWLGAVDASKTTSLIVSEFSAATPTDATLIQVQEITIPTTDLATEIDRAAFGLTTGTNYYGKQPVRVVVTPGNHIRLNISGADSSTWYARYQVRKDI